MEEDSYALTVFKALDTDDNGFVVKNEILDIINQQGLQFHVDLKNIIQFLEERFDEEPILIEKISDFIIQNSFLRQVLEAQLVIPNFLKFTNKMTEIYEKITLLENEGKNYHLTKLDKVDTEIFGVGFTSVDGQIFNIGDTKQKFHIGFIGRILAYTYAYELIGEEVHKWVGEEPSGQFSDHPIFDHNNQPHNPIIDSGCILICALIIRQGKNINDIISFYKKITFSKKIEIDHDLASQFEHLFPSDSTLTNLMLAKNIFPKYQCHNDTMEKTIEAVNLYWQIACILVEVESLSLLGGCLANNGKNVLNSEQQINPNTIHAVNPILMTCGMQNIVGYFIEHYGLPCIGGWSGDFLSIIPGLGAIVTYSPLIDQNWNSVRGIQVIENLGEYYSDFNLFYTDRTKKCLRHGFFQKELDTIQQGIKAAFFGDLDNLKILYQQDLDLDAVNYDHQTMLHIATAQGFFNVVKWLIKHRVKINKKDRWNHTALDYSQNDKISELLMQAKAHKSKNPQNINLMRLNENDNFNRIMYGVFYNQMNVIQVLRITDWQVYDIDHNGRGPVHLAASEGHLDIFKYLVCNDADHLQEDLRGNDSSKDAEREHKNNIIDEIFLMNQKTK